MGRADYIALVTNGSPVSYLWCQHVSTHFSLQVYEINLCSCSRVRERPRPAALDLQSTIARDALNAGKWYAKVWSASPYKCVHGIVMGGCMVLKK